MISTELMLRFLEKEQPRRFRKIRKAFVDDEGKGITMLELFKQEVESNTSLSSSVRGVSVHDDRDFLRGLEDRHSTQGIKYINGYYEMNTLKKLSSHLLQTSTNNILTFLVSKEKIISGKITSLVFEHKQKIPIAFECEEKTSGSPHYFGLGEKFDKKSFKVLKRLYGEFWVYQFSTGKKEYMLYSEKELDIKRYVIEGSLLEFEDYPLVGSSLRMNVMISTIIVHNAKSKVPVFKNNAELVNATKDLKRDDWLGSLFTDPKAKMSYRHPDLFETLISAFLLGTPPANESHLHLLIIGKPGTGKSTMGRCIWHKFEENQRMLRCGASTLKALVPSFGSTPVKCGYLISADRIAIADEFLRILTNIKECDREHQLGRLNDLLDNVEGLFSSGKGSINSMMSARLMAVSNPVWYTSTMERLADFTDEAFLSRLFVWFQSEKHAEMVRTRKGRKEPVKILNKDMFLGVYDYCQTFTSSFDEEIITGLISKYDAILIQDDNMKKSLDVFRARHLHHACCLIDGIVKTRCLTTQRLKFVAIKEDYEMLDNLLNEMIIQWGVNLDSKEKLRY